MTTIRETLWQLRDQYRAESDPEKKKAIQEQYERALDAALEITAHDIGANTAEYETAVAALEQANEDLRQARAGLQDFADNVMKVAKAVDILVKVAKKVAGGV
jgi:chromosome segregation ATPase